MQLARRRAHQRNDVAAFAQAFSQARPEIDAAPVYDQRCVDAFFKTLRKRPEVPPRRPV